MSGVFDLRAGAGDAVMEAMVADWQRITGRPEVTFHDLKARVGKNVTLLMTGETLIGQKVFIGRQGKLFDNNDPKIVALIPKGKRTRGLQVEPQKVVDMLDGYQPGEAVRLAEEVNSHFPKLRPLTQERLEQLPSSSGECTLAVFGTWRMPDCRAVGTLHLIGEYDKENDICDALVTLIRPEFGISEKGSVFGKQLLGQGFGEVIGFQPIGYADAVDLCWDDFDVAIAKALGRQVTA